MLSLPQSQTLVLKGTLDDQPGGPAASLSRTVLDQSLASRPDLRAFDARRDMAQHSINLANAEWKPNLALTGNMQYQEDGVSSLLNSENQSYTFGIAMRVPLFSAPGASARRGVAQAQAQQAEHGLNAATDGARLELESAWTAYEASQEVVTTQQKALELAREGVVDRTGVVRERRDHVGGAQRRAGPLAADRVAADAGEVQPHRRGGAGEGGGWSELRAAEPRFRKSVRDGNSLARYRERRVTNHHDEASSRTAAWRRGGASASPGGAAN